MQIKTVSNNFFATCQLRYVSQCANPALRALALGACAVRGYEEAIYQMYTPLPFTSGRRVWESRVRRFLRCRVYSGGIALETHLDGRHLQARLF